ETITADLSLNNRTPEYVDYENFSQHYCIPHNHTLLAIAGVCISVCLCGLVGNVAVVCFLGFHMKKSPFTIYVLNLAIADLALLLFLVVILSFYIVSTLSCSLLFEHFVAKYVLMDLFLFWYFASMYLLTAMSVERCLSVL
ncbi:MRGRD protein, partial [Rhynochetos jubatus]|nr:MRGRD protein [Rhynochetos jubatus]